MLARPGNQTKVAPKRNEGLALLNSPRYRFAKKNSARFTPVNHNGSTFLDITTVNTLTLQSPYVTALSPQYLKTKVTTPASQREPRDVHSKRFQSFRQSQ